MVTDNTIQLLNLGCGKRFHPDWINIDFVSSSKDVIACNLLKGIPYESNTFAVVYHSHVLEHFPKNEVNNFIAECFRVLKKDGIIRIAVPDFEALVKEYLHIMEKDR